MTEEILHKLKERVKELTALHKTARILQDETKSAIEVMREIVALMPPAWQYSEITVARIHWGALEASTPGYVKSRWSQESQFMDRGGRDGSIEVCYLEERPDADEGPFLREERDLIDSLAEMLRSYFQHLLADEDLQCAHDNLEHLVSAKTDELQRANDAMQLQIAAYRKAEQKIEIYQSQLRQLASELSLTEARERRAIAEDLHDHIGQALAFIKINISQFRGNAIFCGFEGKIDEIMTLLDQTIQYTRNLTFEISPPVLYELGLEAALEWLADQYNQKHELKVRVKGPGAIGPIEEELQVMLFKSVQELLINVLKHAQADEATISMDIGDDLISIEVADNGRGFEVSALESGPVRKERFGLFSIRERLGYLGGRIELQSIVGTGTKVTLLASRRMKEGLREN